MEIKKTCSDCKFTNLEKEFHMNKDKTKFYSKRCKPCQNIYRHNLKTKDLDTVNCIICKRYSNEIIFNIYKLNGVKKFLSTCHECEKNVIIKEKYCKICKESSYNKDFRIKIYNNLETYTPVCKECEEFLFYKKFCKKYNLQQKKCKTCNKSSEDNIFPHYKLRTNVILQEYCNSCFKEENLIKLCSKCGNNTNRKYSICLNCINKHGKERRKRNADWKLKYTKVVRQLNTNFNFKERKRRNRENNKENIKKTYTIRNNETYSNI
jgi:hypothetical protein